MIRLYDGLRSYTGAWTSVAKRIITSFDPSSGQEVANLIFDQGRNPPLRTTRQFLESYNTMPWLRAVVHRIAYTVASTPWTLHLETRPSSRSRTRSKDFTAPHFQTRVQALQVAKQAGDVEQVTDHPLLDLIDFSNGFFTGLTTRMLTQIHLEIVGEAFWIIERDEQGIPSEIWPLPPHWIKDTPDPAHPFFNVQFNSAIFDIPLTEVVWFYSPRPEDPYRRGSGLMESLGDELETDELTAKYLKQFFYNGARPDTIISLVGQKDNSRKRAEMHWNQRHQGFWRAFKPFFTSRSIDVQTLGHQHEQMQLVPLRHFERDTILQVAGVQPEILGILKDANRASMVVAEQLFAKQVVMPRMELMREVMQVILAPQFGDGLFLGFENPIPDDADFELQAATAAPWSRTVDEWRRLQGLPDMEDNRGRVFLVPDQLVSVQDFSEMSQENRLGLAARTIGDGSHQHPLQIIDADAIDVTPTLLRSPQHSVIPGTPGVGKSSRVASKRRGLRHPKSTQLPPLSPSDEILSDEPELRHCLDPEAHPARDPDSILAHLLCSPACHRRFHDPTVLSEKLADCRTIESLIVRIAAVDADDFESALQIVADRFGPRLQRLYSRFANRQVREIDEQALLNALQGNRVNAAMEILDPERWSGMFRDLAKEIETLVSLSGETAAQIFNDLLDTDLGFDPNLPSAERLVDEGTQGVIDALRDSADEGLRRQIQELNALNLTPEERAFLLRESTGLSKPQMDTLRKFYVRLGEEGVSDAKRATRVEKLARAMRKRRGDVLGNTNATTMANLAQSEMALQGVDEGVLSRSMRRRWDVINDDRLDLSVCEPMDGQVAGLLEWFTTGTGGSVFSPAAHPM